MEVGGRVRVRWAKEGPGKNTEKYRGGARGGVASSARGGEATGSGMGGLGRVGREARAGAEEEVRWRGGERGNTERDEDEAAEEEGGKRESRKRFAGAPAGHTHTHSHTESHLPASAVPEHHHSIAVIHVGARWRTTRYGVKRWQFRGRRGILRCGNHPLEPSL